MSERGNSGTFRVEQIRIDYSISLVLEKFGIVEFSTPFNIESDESRKVIDPGEGSDFSAAQALLHETVTQVLWSDAGDIELVFQSGIVVRGYADSDYEAWQIRTEGGSTVIALPGGGVTMIER